MALTAQQMTRAFEYAGMELPDIGADLSVDEVRETYSASYPELLTATTEGPEIRGNRLVYSFKRAAGAKG